mmetsp:Transcript_16630/g.52160  ORF Transcript_16630/g.52160 Transcript_16630/m.52160 type:complete len:203 (-) Transcript_16630:393-1001(-)
MVTDPAPSRAPRQWRPRPWCPPRRPPRKSCAQRPRPGSRVYPSCRRSPPRPRRRPPCPGTRAALSSPPRIPPGSAAGSASPWSAPSPWKPTSSTTPSAWRRAPPPGTPPAAWRPRPGAAYRPVRPCPSASPPRRHAAIRRGRSSYRPCRRARPRPGKCRSRGRGTSCRYLPLPSSCRGLPRRRPGRWRHASRTRQTSPASTP